ncbi:MAG: alpha/beta fold hydrolase [Thermoanaerobaculia bacterium]
MLATADHPLSNAIPLEPPPDPFAAARSLERKLGDPLDDRRPGCFLRSVEADSSNRFPRELVDAALEWGLAEYLIPAEVGGRLHSLEVCFALSRVLSRRDLTAAIALGVNLLAALPVWLHGTDEQKRVVANLMRRHRFLSFALSEREHGADVVAGGVTAHKAEHGWRIDGEKWLINNAGHASAAIVTARTGQGIRGLTLFLLQRAAAAGDQWSMLPRIETHGLRGSAFGGIRFSGFPAENADVVGRPGDGLPTLLKTLQITRVLVASFALGGLDTCLRAALAFARSRRLEGSVVDQMEPVARRLVDAYADLAVGETLALAACRAAHLAPAQLPLMSACVKFLVPQLATDGIESLALVLGAHSYLAGEHWHGIFDKMRRDCAVTPLFDGSSPVNLGAIVDQLAALAAARAAQEVADVDPELFRRQAPGLPWVDEEALDFATDSDAVHRGIAAAREAVRNDGDRVVYRRQLLDLLAGLLAESRRLDREVQRHAQDAEWRRSGAAYDLAARYSRLHAAGACAWKWLTWRDGTGEDFFASGAWLVLCLRRLAGGMGSAAEAFDDVDRAALLRLQQAGDQGLLFSDFEIPVPALRPPAPTVVPRAPHGAPRREAAWSGVWSGEPPPPDRKKVYFRDGSSTELCLFRANAPDAPVVLCLPAMGVRASYYEVFGDTLAEQGFHTALADLRGHGTSSVRPSRRVSFGYADILELELPAIVESVCEEFETEKVIVVGHSLGGQMGVLFASTSTRVSHVVLVASGSCWYRRVPGIRALGRFLGLQLIVGTTLACGRPPKWLPVAGGEARRLILEWGHEAMTGRFRVSGSSIDYEKALGESTVPALFAVFPGDHFVPGPCSDHLAGKLGNAVVARQEIPPQALRLRKTHHFRWAMRPQAVAELVREWIEPQPADAGLRAVV